MVIAVLEVVGNGAVCVVVSFHNENVVVFDCTGVISGVLMCCYKMPCLDLYFNFELLTILNLVMR